MTLYDTSTELQRRPAGIFHEPGSHSRRSTARPPRRQSSALPPRALQACLVRVAGVLVPGLQHLAPDGVEVLVVSLQQRLVQAPQPIPLHSGGFVSTLGGRGLRKVIPR